MKTENYSSTTLENVCGGAVASQFEHELQNVLRNIEDVNTDPEQKREIRIKVSFSPTKDRSMAQITGTVESKLAGLRPVGTAAFMGEDDDGNPTIFARDPRQVEAFPEEDEKAGVTSIHTRAQEAK